MLKRVLAAIALFWLVGCSSPQQVDARQFKELFLDSKNDSVVSWWYHGEDNDFYHLSQKYPMNETKFNVSKKGVVLRNISSIQEEKSGVPVNLKTENVVFDENAL